MIYTDAALEAAAEAVDIALADLPVVLADPTHPSHAELVAELTAPAEAVPAPV
jgi:hypothetical protein